MLSEELKRAIHESESANLQFRQAHAVPDSCSLEEDELKENIASYQVFARQRALLLHSLRESESLLSRYSQFLRDAKLPRLGLQSILFQRVYLYIVRVLIRIL